MSEMQNQEVAKAAAQEVQQEAVKHGSDYRGPGNCAVPSDCANFCLTNPDDATCQALGVKHIMQEKKAPPTACPGDLKNAGACGEFAQVMCAAMKISMKADLIDKFRNVASYLDAVSSEKGLNLDTGKLKAISNRIDANLNGLCAANDSTIEAAMKSLMSSISDSDINTAVNDVVSQVQSKYFPKLDAAVAEIHKAEAELSALTAGGGKVDEAQVSALVAKIDSYSAQATAIGNEMETVLVGISSKLEEKSVATDPALELDAAQKQVALTQKMMTYHSDLVEKLANGFESRGYNVSYLRTTLAEMKQYEATAEACIKTHDASTGPPDECMAAIEAKKTEWETKGKASIQGQIEKKYMDAIEKIRPQINNGIALAKTKGIDTSKLEAVLAKLDTYMAIGRALDAKVGLENQQEAFGLLDEFQAAMGELNTEWKAVSAQLQ